MSTIHRPRPATAETHGRTCRTASLLAALCLGTLGCTPAVETEASVIAGTKTFTGPVLGSGAHAFTWASKWLQLPEGTEQLGPTHGGIVIDTAGRILASQDGDQAILVLDADGAILDRWGEDLGPGVHGLCLDMRDGREWLWMAHSRAHQVIAATLDGEIVARLPWPEASGHYERESDYVPTGVAVAPDGSVYVADGYGKSWVHRYGPDHAYVASFGGPGSEPGQFQTPHGLCLERHQGRNVLLVADRENHRLQRFELDGTFLEVVAADLRRPCTVHERNGHVVVADLAGRVTILGPDDALITHLGDNPDSAQRANYGVPPDAWTNGVFTAPHAAAWGPDGSLYVMDWNRWGRLTRLVPTQG